MIYYHVHSDLSNATTVIDSITKYQEYIEKAKNYGCKALGFSEHGNIFEWWHKKCTIEKSGMKYIHGFEAYVTESINLEDKKRDNYHVVLMAKNHEGFKEINLLVSKSFNRADVKVIDEIERYYYSPRITYDELKATSDNIIITTACLGGILYKGNDWIKEDFIRFLQQNKHRCFLEVQHHDVKDQSNYNRHLASLSAKYDIPLIAGTDSHMANNSEIVARDLLQKSKNVHFDSEDGWDLVMRSEEEIIESYKSQNALSEDEYMSAIKNTDLLYDMIEPFEIDKSNKYPKISNNAFNDMVKIVEKGIKEKGLEKTQSLKDRLNYEISTYKHNNAIDLMLLEYDVKKWAKENDIFYGESRGSVSGSMIAYLMGVTKVNSMKYGLNFERFMNKERVSLADIDSDWMPSKRDLVKEYLHQNPKYETAEIVTFNTVAWKGSIRDIGRALDIPLNEINQICNDEENESALSAWQKKYPKLFDYALQVEGTIVSIGSHPAATICSPINIQENIGTVTLPTNKYPVACLNMKEVDDLNFVKLDVLGLKNVEIIYNTCKLAGIEPLESDKVDFNDKEVWKDIMKSPLGIFQYEGDYAHSYLKQVFSEKTLKRIREKNPNVDYLYLMSIANGAIRPAGDSYREALSNGEFNDNGHEVLNDFLKDTNSFLVFQEQILDFLHLFCGFTMGEADIVRCGFAKKTGTEQFMPRIKSGFIKTMKDKYDVGKKESEEIVEKFIKVIESASNYLFSLNHSIPYSMIGYMCGWLRYYYPLEFIATLLELNSDNQDKTSEIYDYMNKFTNFKVMPIKFRYSNEIYNIDKENNTIYKSISSIKHLNAQVAQELYELRNNKYDSFIDLLKDLKYTAINARQLDILIKLDFFSEFGKPKKLLTMVEFFSIIDSRKTISKGRLESWIEEIVSQHARETKSQYRDLENDAILQKLCENIPNEDITIKEKIEIQKDYLGYVDIRMDTNKMNCIILDINTKYKPKITLASLQSGKNIVAKCTKEMASTINENDLVHVSQMKQEFGWTKSDSGKWLKDPNKKEWHIKKMYRISEKEL
jgi:DNA polymerase-3 subunit alpha